MYFTDAHYYTVTHRTFYSCSLIPKTALFAWRRRFNGSLQQHPQLGVLLPQSLSLVHQLRDLSQNATEDTKHLLSTEENLLRTPAFAHFLLTGTVSVLSPLRPRALTCPPISRCLNLPNRPRPRRHRGPLLAVSRDASGLRCFCEVVKTRNAAFLIAPKECFYKSVFTWTWRPAQGSFLEPGGACLGRWLQGSRESSSCLSPLRPDRWIRLIPQLQAVDR